MSTVRFSSFPRTAPPPPFTREVLDVFRRHESTIDTELIDKGLTSDEVLGVLRDDDLRVDLSLCWRR